MKPEALDVARPPPDADDDAIMRLRPPPDGATIGPVPTPAW